MYIFSEMLIFQLVNIWIFFAHCAAKELRVCGMLEGFNLNFFVISVGMKRRMVDIKNK